MLKVYKTCCANCPLSKDAIVPPDRRREIVEGCKIDQTHFICHKASMEDKEVLCKTFYDKFGHFSQLVRIAERLGAVQYVPQPESKKLTPWRELNK